MIRNVINVEHSYEKLANTEVKKKARCDLSLILHHPPTPLLALSWFSLAIKVYTELCYITWSSAEIQNCRVRVSMCPDCCRSTSIAALVWIP